MNFRQNFINDLYKINESNFNKKALELFYYQYHNNSFYARYADSLKKNPSKVSDIEEIPYLPVGFFKTEKIITGDKPEEICFLSSGTTEKEVRSKHFIVDVELYKQNFRQIFREFYGAPEEYIILALLPSYEENKSSSLIFMVNDLIRLSNHEESGFVSVDSEKFTTKLSQLKQLPQKKIILGVSYALLDLAEKYAPDLSNFIVMETGGMKGRRKEMSKHEMHQVLKESFNVNQIHSEYGMTELLSQAYSKGEGLYQSPAHMKILIRQPSDPFDIRKEGRGAVNVIDLANIDSCAFVEIQDLANLYSTGNFEILGRMDNSEMRGCNLLYS